MKNVHTMLIGVLVTLMSILGMVDCEANTLATKPMENVSIMHTNPPSIFVDEGRYGIETVLLEAGVLKADVYQLQIKKENNFYYGLAGDVQIGDAILVTLLNHYEPLHNQIVIGNTEEWMARRYRQLRQLADVAEILGNAWGLRLVYHETTHTYDGIMCMGSYIADTEYSQTVHICLYEDMYYGPSVRFIALDSTNDSMLYPLVKHIMKLQK